MKKICLALLLVLMLAALIACGGETGTTATTTEPPATADAPLLPEGERVVKKTYTAVLNDAEWNPSVIDATSYDMFNTGVEIYKALVAEKGYALTAVIVGEDGEQSYTGTKIFEALKAVGICGVKLTKDTAAKTLTAKVYPMTIEGQLAWKAINVQAGAYARFEFCTNYPIACAITVTETEGGSSLYTNDGLLPTGEGTKYVAMGQITAPFEAGKTYYLNLCIDTAGYPAIASIPLNTVESPYDMSTFKLTFTGDWTYVNDERYMENFAYYFYMTYPKLYARWGGTGREPTEVALFCDNDKGGVASAGGARISYSVNNLNSGNPELCGGALTHEMVHLVQKFNIGPCAWLGECMANYGRFRYWSYGYYPEFVEEESVQAALDWKYARYFHGQLFFAWMDWAYPTIDKNGDGKRTPDEYGLFDYIVYSSKEWTGVHAGDDPYDETTMVNQWVKEKTGYASFELLRQEYVRQLSSGKYNFKGFRDFEDNWITENLPGVPNPDYPMHEEIKPTAKTNPVLAAAVTVGDNLCKNAVIHRVSSAASSEKYPETALIDGNLETRYQAAPSSKLYKMNNICNEIVIDLGAVKTFDTYTLVCYNNSASQIAKAWEILVSDNGTNFTAVDYQKDNTQATVSVTFDAVSARYVKIRLFESDQNQMNITRLCEFMLFKREQ